MDSKECEICSKLVKQKYKNFKTWKTLAIVFICLTVLFAILYFASGDLMSSTTIKYENDVKIENNGGENTNTDNGNIIVEKQNDSTGGVILLSAILLVGGIIGGCFIISQVHNNNKEQGNDK